MAELEGVPDRDADRRADSVVTAGRRRKLHGSFFETAPSNEHPPDRRGIGIEKVRTMSSQLIEQAQAGSTVTHGSTSSGGSSPACPRRSAR